MFVVAHNGASSLGGGEIGTALLLAGLQARGHRVLMLCRDERMARRIAGYGISTGVQRVGGAAMLADGLRLAGRLRALRPDALVLTTYKKVFLAGLGARLAGVPFVVQRVVLSSDRPRKATFRFALRHFVHAVVLNADAMRPAFVAPGTGLDPSRVLTIHDGVRPPALRAGPGAVRRELGIPPDAFVVGSVARLARQKRFDRLLHALARLPGVHAVIAGEGGEADPLARLAAELGLADRVHLLGFRQDVGDVLAALDLFVLSSDSEGMANAMLEAMAVGLPVVSTEVSGAREALGAAAGGDPAGLVVGFDERELAAAVSALGADPARRAAMGRAARERWERRFSWDRFLDEWEALLAGGVAREGGE